MEIKEKLDLIMKKLDDIDNKLNILSERQETNDNKINNLENSCSKMNNHINFVEDTYNTLKAPLSFVKHNVERLMGSNYQATNLPSINVLLTSRIPNRSLIIYNHGHDGLPTNNQSWAVDFINRALQDGYSFLITSMPLVGLNAPDPAVEYYMIPKGDQGFTSIGKSLLQWPIIHQIYQAINGSGNFMHFFVDGSVLPAHFLGPNSKPRSYL